MLKFIIGGAGFGKSGLLMDEIGRIAEKGNSVTAIVPEQFSFDFDKKLYRKIGCRRFNNILSLSFTTLAREIFEKYGSRSGEYADDMNKLIIMRKAVKQLSDDGQLRFFSKQASKPDFISDMLNIITEFRQSGLSSDDFASAMTDSDVTFSEKISELSQIYYTYDRILSESGLKDSLTDISEAAAIAEINGFFKERTVFFDEFESFTFDEYQLIETIISQSDNVYVSLRLENLSENSSGIFESVKNTWKRFCQIASKYGVKTETKKLEMPLKYKSPDLAHLNMNILRPVRNNFNSSENIRITECADLYEEADVVCSEIKRLVRTQGYRYRDIAVMSRQLEEYTYIIEAAFEKYGIPYSMDVKKSVMHTSVMQYVSGIISIISEKNFSSETIFTYAKTHLCGISPEMTADLENYCFEWDIDGAKWLEPFIAGIDEHPLAEETRKKIVLPLLELRRKCMNSDCREICMLLYDFMTASGAQAKASEIADEFDKMGLTFLSKEFKRIWGLLIDILDTLAETGGKMTLPEFRDIFIMMLRHISYSVPPQTLDGVRISRAETARPDSPKAVFVIGVNEGYFPHDISDSGILDERDRIFFERAGIALSRKNEELAADEKLIVYKTLTHASERLYITYPLSDSSGSNRYPAAITRQLQDMFGTQILGYAKDLSLIDCSPTPKSAYMNLVRNFAESSPETESIRRVLKKNNEYSARISFLENVGKEDGFEIKNKDLMRRLYTEKLSISATAVEEYNTCHFKYFCQTGLRLRVRKKRMLDRLGEGNLTHRCLEKILGSCATKEEFDKLSPERIREIIADCEMEFLEESMGGEFLKTPAVTMALEKISENIELLAAHLQKELRQSEFRPAAFELDISRGNDNPIIRTDDGIEIYLHGVVDRIDVFEKDGQKYLRVIDYKTGKKTFSVSSLLYGLNMQMLIYMFSITSKNGEFEGYTPAGVLYMPSGDAGCRRDRDDSGSIEKYLSDHYKMNGIVLRDRTVLNAMEKDIKGVFIPASLNSGDSGSGKMNLNKRSSSCLTRKNFEKLREYTDSILRNMCSELFNGKIEALPFVSGNMTPCSFCDYWSVCGNNPVKHCRTQSADAEKIMMELLGGDDDEQMD